MDEALRLDPPFFYRPLLPGKHHSFERPLPSYVMSRLPALHQIPRAKIGLTTSSKVGGNTHRSYIVRDVQNAEA